MCPVTCVVEDASCYNTLSKSNTGGGIFNTGSCVVFTLNESGHHVSPSSGIVSSRLLRKRKQQIQYLNPQLNYLLEKTAHGFSVGDVIAVSDTGDFVKANA